MEDKELEDPAGEASHAHRILAILRLQEILDVSEDD